MSRKELETAFPLLAADGYRVTSPKSRKYNCIAWAAGDSSKKWDCTGLPMVGFYWPPEAVIGEEIEALISVFRTQGFGICDSGSLETGFDKVVLYADDLGMWTHAAKQLPDGKWSSKIGDGEDIEHSTPQGIAGSGYGHVKHYLKRPQSGLPVSHRMG